MLRAYPAVVNVIMVHLMVILFKPFFNLILNSLKLEGYIGLSHPADSRQFLYYLLFSSSNTVVSILKPIPDVYATAAVTSTYFFRLIIHVHNHDRDLLMLHYYRSQTKVTIPQKWIFVSYEA